MVGDGKLSFATTTPVRLWELVATATVARPNPIVCEGQTTAHSMPYLL